MRTELVVQIEDLQFISILCPRCNTVVTLDTDSRTHLREQYGLFTPKKCPGCQEDYDSAIAPGVDAFRKALAQLKPMADRISFHGPAGDEATRTKPKD